MRATIRVPATSANLGSGFDCLGLALGIHNEVIVSTDEPRPDGARGPRIQISGEGADVLPRDRDNLIYRSIVKLFETIGRPLPEFSLITNNLIPLTGGLGSSSAALVGGLLAGNALAGHPLSRDEVLRLAFDDEGHPDNVAPALLGGLVLCVIDEGQLKIVALPVPAGLKAVVFIPGFSMPTEQARQLLPSHVPHRDAVFNLGRAALLIAAFQTGRLDLLKTATEDRLHQPYRRQMFPSLPRLMSAALDCGALAAFLSGAGSAVLALARGSEESVAAGLQAAATRSGVAGRCVTVDISREGATVSIDHDGPVTNGD
jgi:homoserine kinase